MLYGIGRLVAVLFFYQIAFLGTANAVTSYVPVVSSGSKDYKTIFKPAALTKEAGNYIYLNQVSNFPDKQFRVFMPPGTRRWTVQLTTFLGDQDARAAAKFIEPPLSSYADITPAAMTETSGLTERFTTVASALVAGKELKFYSPPRSGGLTIAQGGGADIINYDVGGWVYFNMLSLPHDLIGNLQVRVVADQVCYDQWINSPTTAWDSVGNPAEVKHSCAGSSVPVITSNVLESIGLSASTIKSSGETSTVTPTPANAELGVCTFSPVTAPISIAANKITLTSLVAQTTPVTITCYGKAANLSLLPIDSALVATATSNESTDKDGKLLLNITLNPLKEDLGKKSTVWIAAEVLPSFAIKDSFYLLMTQSGWQPYQPSIDFSKLIFKADVSLTDKTPLTLATGVKKLDIPPNVKIHLMYRVASPTQIDRVINSVWVYPN